MKRRDLKIIWSSNASWTYSGYGSWIGAVLPRLVKDGWKVALSAFAGHSGGVIEHDGYPIYPVLADTFGGDALVYHGKHFQANVAMTMQDIWTINPQYLQGLKDSNIKFIPYVPIDQSPVPPQVLDRLRYAHKIISFSKFGQKELEKSGFSSTLIPEGIDTNIFKPIDKTEAKKKFGLPQDKFVVGMIGANKENPSRKGWQEGLEAFKLFSDKHPEAIFFYHSNQNIPAGFPISDYARHLGILDKVFHLDEYTSLVHTGPTVINELLNTFDFLIHPSATEGFGLLPIEAMSAGIPVIVNNSTSQPEMIVEGVGYICEAGRKFFSPAQGFWQFADVDSLYEKMEALFKADRVKMGKAGREHVLKNYDIDKIVKEQWIPFYEGLQEELLPVLDKEVKK